MRNVYLLGIIMGQLLCLIGFLYLSCVLTFIYCPLPLFVIFVRHVLNDVLPIVCLCFINPLTPNDPYRGRTAPLTCKVAFYLFI